MSKMTCKCGKLQLIAHRKEIEVVPKALTRGLFDPGGQRLLRVGQVWNSQTLRPFHRSLAAGSSLHARGQRPQPMLDGYTPPPSGALGYRRSAQRHQSASAHSSRSIPDRCMTPGLSQASSALNHWATVKSRPLSSGPSGRSVPSSVSAMAGSVQQIIKLSGLYVLCYREFVSKPECKGGYFVLDNQELQEEMHAIEISACGVVRMYFASGVWCLC